MSARFRTYKAWYNMVHRCTNPKATGYENYGGRGISVCDRWLDYKNFREDMGKQPYGLFLERVDNNGNYEIGNCKWATRIEQNSNQRPQKISKKNTSGVKGVVWNSHYRRWQASAYEKGNRVYLYNGSSFERAQQARASWETQHK